MRFSRSVVCLLSACLLVQLCYPKIQYAESGLTDSPNSKAHYNFPNGSVELIASPDTQNRILLGVHFKIDPGWHIYWKNPGDTGLASQVRWQVSNGLSVEETRYPTPKRMEANGLVNFGYDHETLLRGAIILPRTPIFPSQILVKADVSWVLCNEECQPGGASLILPISTAAAASGNPPSNLILSRGERSFPEDMTWATARISPDSIELRATYENGAQLAHPQFFPEDEKIVDIHLPITATRSGNLISYLIPRLPAEPLDNKALRGVLVFGAGNEATAYQINTPLLEAPSQSADVMEPEVRIRPKKPMAANVVNEIDDAQRKPA